MNQKQAENKLLLGLILALDKGLINENMVKTVLKNVARVKSNQEFLKTLVMKKSNKGWKRWPSYFAANPDSETFDYLSFGGVLYYRWAT